MQTTSSQDKPMIHQGLLAVVKEVAAEIHPGELSRPISLTTRLDYELGFDSLSRVELLSRIEQVFSVKLPETALMQVETPGDLLKLLEQSESQPRETSPILALQPVAKLAESPSTEHLSTLTEILTHHAQVHGDRPYLRFCETGQTITYTDLYQDSLKIATGLRRRGVMPQQAVGLMLTTSREFFISFFGCLYAGCVPVPLYPPSRISQLADHLQRQVRILDNAEAVLLITFDQAKPFTALLQAKVGSLQEIVAAEDLFYAGDPLEPVSVSPQDTAFLQYTSGSTGTPKGVVLSHANLLANVRAMGTAFKVTSSDVFISWLPLYHDMGLIGACLGSLHYACLLVVMPPQNFLARPERWLRAIHDYRGTIAAGPNFGFELCLRKIKDEDLQGLDLSSWRMALNGAEPVSPRTMDQFCDKFAAYGFRREAMSPVYGLAECSVGLTGPPPGRGPNVEWIDRQSFTEHGKAVPVQPNDPHAMPVVGCGFPFPDHQVRVVDKLGYEVPDRVQGKIQFRGPSATVGYFRNPEATAALIRGEWLETGDLGYIAGGEIFIAGRSKDIIIRAGRNLYPQELEDIVGNLPGVRTGCVAVFACPDPHSGTERLVIVAETRETNAVTLDTLRTQINQATLQLLDSAADEIVLAPPHSVLKTSSGKIRRSGTRDSYLNGDLFRPRSPFRDRLNALKLKTAGTLQSMIHRTGLFLFGAWCWLVFVSAVLISCVLLVVIPTLKLRRGYGRWLARLVMITCGMPIVVDGAEHLPADQACVYVANHASYIDAIVIMAILPPNTCFTAKKELAEHWLIRFALDRLGTEYLDRFDFQESLNNIARLEELARAHQSLGFFAEGTFTREPGLRAFHLGAFKTAATARLPVVPVALHGTRSILRDEQWLPHRGDLRVTIFPPLVPKGTDWSAVIALRDAARAAILEKCGEPDLANIKWPK